MDVSRLNRGCWMGGRLRAGAACAVGAAACAVPRRHLRCHACVCTACCANIWQCLIQRHSGSDWLLLVMPVSCAILTTALQAAALPPGGAGCVVPAQWLQCGAWG